MTTPMTTGRLAATLPLAALLTLAACQDTAPALVVEPEMPDEISVAIEGLTPEDWYMTYVVPARWKAYADALDEIRRTFTVEDMYHRRWRERWPELWGPNGTDAVGHWAPPRPLGPEEHKDSPEFRREMGEEFQRYLEENQQDNPHFNRHLTERRR